MHGVCRIKHWNTWSTVASRSATWPVDKARSAGRRYLTVPRYTDQVHSVGGSSLSVVGWHGIHSWMISVTRRVVEIVLGVAWSQRFLLGISLLSVIEMLRDVHYIITLPLTSRLVVPSVRLSTVASRAFPVVGPRIWNEIRTDVTSAESLSTFRQRLKTNLFTKSFPGYFLSVK